MSEALRLKIKTDTGKDPQDRNKWKYDELEESIKKHAVVPVDPAILARNMHNTTMGKNIDETNEKIEYWFEAMEHASQGNKAEKVSADRRKTEEDRFVDKRVKDTIKWILLRAHLMAEIAQEVRTFEISSNEGLGLPNN